MKNFSRWKFKILSTLSLMCKVTIPAPVPGDGNILYAYNTDDIVTKCVDTDTAAITDPLNYDDLNYGRYVDHIFRNNRSLVSPECISSAGGDV